MMKKCIVMILFFMGVLLSPSQIFAHILETDGSIGAVLHIDPEDDPIINQQAGFFFEFKDKNNKFMPQLCECSVTINENGKQIYTQPLFQNSQDASNGNASFFYVFPKKDIYEIRLTGKAIDNTSFDPFTLAYTIRVSREATNQSVQSSNWVTTRFVYVFIGGTILGLVILLAVKNLFLKNQSEKAKGGDTY